MHRVETSLYSHGRLRSVCVICVITGFKTDVQQLAQMLGAAVVPGNSQANMYLTLYGYNSCAQGLSLARDLKMGQYTKLPHRHTHSPGKRCSELASASSAKLIIMEQVILKQREILLDTQAVERSLRIRHQNLCGRPMPAKLRSGVVEDFICRALEARWRGRAFTRYLEAESLSSAARAAI
ncbi:hypothetical protein JCM10908_003512 [Rhodotorula pacifica]|uniref:uncharacterized protein n=1 Tax=Rhodotorula pacifica TaxID=1495444 RepID=UPI003170180E